MTELGNGAVVAGFAIAFCDLVDALAARGAVSGDDVISMIAADCEAMGDDMADVGHVLSLIAGTLDRRLHGPRSPEDLRRSLRLIRGDEN